MHSDGVSRDRLEILDIFGKDLFIVRVQTDHSRCLIAAEFHGCIIILFTPLFICFHVRQLDQAVANSGRFQRPAFRVSFEGKAWTDVSLGSSPSPNDA
jgi:hypothetical protein